MRSLSALHPLTWNLHEITRFLVVENNAPLSFEKKAAERK